MNADETRSAITLARLDLVEAQNYIISREDKREAALQVLDNAARLISEARGFWE